jgi:hypothetical protein
MKTLSRLSLFTLSPLIIVSSLNAASFTGPSGGVWSDATNWLGETLPTATDEVIFPQNENGTINVDGDYTVAKLVDGFGDGGLTVSGTGTLTVNTRVSGFFLGIESATGNAGNTLRFFGNIAINNSGGGRTGISNALGNSPNNSIRFNPESHLILTTGLQTGRGAIQFNGKISGENLFIGADSTEASINEGHDSTELSAVVFFRDSSLTINGGTVLSNEGKFQINGPRTHLEINAANVVQNANISLAGSNDFTVDINADQAFGAITLNNGSLTINIDDSVQSVTFLNSAENPWDSGSMTINGFKEGLLRFGSDSTALTREQLDLINDGEYSLSNDGYLTEATISYWAGYQIVDQGYALLSPWFERYAYVGAAPLIFILNSGWFYIPESVGLQQAGWVYAYDLAAQSIYYEGDSGYGYSYGLGKWVYTPVNLEGQSAAWLYIL